MSTRHVDLELLTELVCRTPPTRLAELLAAMLKPCSHREVCSCVHGDECVHSKGCENIALGSRHDITLVHLCDKHRTGDTRDFDWAPLLRSLLEKASLP